MRRLRQAKNLINAAENLPRGHDPQVAAELDSWSTSSPGWRDDWARTLVLDQRSGRGQGSPEQPMHLVDERVNVAHRPPAEDDRMHESVDLGLARRVEPDHGLVDVATEPVHRRTGREQLPLQ